MRGLWHRVLKLARSACIAPIRIYQRFVSPLTPPSCRFVPTCSEYTAQAIERFGIVRGVLKGMWRVVRCNPFGGSGYDPVEPDCPSIVTKDEDAPRG